MTDTSTKEDASKSASIIDDTTYDTVVKFPAAKYPQTASHIMTAIAKGKPAVCTIDRSGAETSRKEALAGIATKEDYDRDEWPMAICVEGGEGADVAYVESSDNRSAGSWLGNKLSDYSDGTRILFTMAVEEKQVSSTTTQQEPAKVTNKKAEVVAESLKKVETKKESVVEAEPVMEDEPEEYVSYKNCSAVRAAGKAPLLEGEPGYSTKLDRDRDGVACE
ncbi:excalibur calcium-binding domain-containing protein [Paenibacillus sp. PK4536]|uniref:excalibur calcium-binding domain-containing protein n=1 Tax=Paenibacillus sp. PK4536 TaxID=3024576 RepID=UPI002358F8D9|nr:excalibur calcium-binding domain-containing protein [Paenibacillus sp. PK4536]WIM38496.1 excalibur calcium-binding domain-containing protein [Paenibacillus sp. PK4536]